MKKINNFLPLIILTVFIATIAIAVLKANQNQDITANESNNFSAITIKQKIKLPEFSLPDLYNDNKSLSINDLVNDKRKYSIVNFFASWCTTCQIEHSALMRIKKENFIDIYGIAWHDFKDNASDFLKKNGNPFKKVALDSQGLFTRIMNIKAVPETIVINSEGLVVLRYQGNITDETIAEIKNYIKQNK